MFDRDVALKIMEKVNKEKKCLVADDSNLILGFKNLKYYYASEEDKSVHSKQMIDDGYELVEQSREGLYVNLMLDRYENIYVTVGIYTKYNYYKPFIETNNQ